MVVSVRTKMLTDTDIKAYKVLAACCLGNLASGFPVNSFGTVLLYVVSYLREDGSDVRSSGVSFVPIMCTIILSVTMFTGSLLEYLLGYTWSLIGVSAVFIASLMLNFVALKSFGAIVVIYCILGYCEGVLLVTFLSTAMEWFPKKRGLAAGVSALGSGFSGFVFAAIQSAFINPWNYVPDHAPYVGYPDEKYFTQHDLLKRVPQSFLIVSAVSCVLLSIAVTLVSRPTEEEKTQLSGIKLKLIDSDPLLLEPDVQPFKMVKSPHFWVFFIIFGLGRCDFIFMNSLSKVFGESFINNDHFLATTGAIAGLMNGGGRLAWGTLSDVIGIQKTLMVQTGVLTLLMFTFYATKLGGEPMYFVWVSAIIFTSAGGFSLLPAAAMTFFGCKNTKLKIGFLYISQGVGALLQGFLMLGWHIVLQWKGIMNIFGFCSLLAFLFSCLLHFVLKAVREERMSVLSRFTRIQPFSE
ncbi:oxalate:formate antiporter-like [Bolinopsis microptera]|uniref:oxalate:formate antiporter-like n=1 Tax=Bolinopsis microptera TaxID=2820187 RepID=UPI00307960AE